MIDALALIKVRRALRIASQGYDRATINRVAILRAQLRALAQAPQSKGVREIVKASVALIETHARKAAP